MTGLPGPLLEALSGIMLVLFGCMLLSAAIYFVQQLRELGSVTRVYLESKASFAAAILFFGMFTRTLIIWWARHLQDHGQVSGNLEAYMTPGLALTAVPIIWGSICWMNAVLPLRFGPWSWFFIAFGAVAFGIYMAM